MPSAVSRLLSQVLQNGVVVEAMMPKTVPSGRMCRCAGAELFSMTGSIGPYRFSRAVRISAPEKTLSIDHCGVACNQSTGVSEAFF